METAKVKEEVSVKEEDIDFNFVTCEVVGSENGGTVAKEESGVEEITLHQRIGEEDSETDCRYFSSGTTSTYIGAGNSESPTCDGGNRYTSTKIQPRLKRSLRNERKMWAVFDFFDDRPNSLFSVPATWIHQHNSRSKERRISQHEATAAVIFCYWPKSGTKDERNIQSLIRQCSEPNRRDWLRLSGTLKGKFSTLERADEFITCCSNTPVTDGQIECLTQTGIKNSGLAYQRVSITASENNSVSSGSRRSHLRRNTSSKRIKTEDDVRSHPEEQKPHSKSSLHELADLLEEDDTLMEHTPLLPINGTCSNEQLVGAVNKLTDAMNLNSARLVILSKKLDALIRAMPSIDTTSEKINKICGNLVKEKAYEDFGGSYHDGIINPMEILTQLNFPAATCEALRANEAQFAGGEGTEESASLNQTSLLKALIVLAPRPTGPAKKLSPVKACRSLMQRLASDSIWQYWSGKGKNTSKPGFSKEMQGIYRCVCVALMNTQNIDMKTAEQAVGIYLKKCTDRAQSRKFRSDSAASTSAGKPDVDLVCSAPAAAAQTFPSPSDTNVTKGVIKRPLGTDSDESSVSTIVDERELLTLCWTEDTNPPIHSV